MVAYVIVTKELIQEFQKVEVVQIGRAQNAHANVLVNLASAIESGMSRSMEFGLIEKPSINQRGNPIGRMHRVRADLDGPCHCLPQK